MVGKSPSVTTNATVSTIATSTSGVYVSNNPKHDFDDEPIEQSVADIEIHIRQQRILAVFDDAMRQLELAACLPQLVDNNGRLLQEYLSLNDLQAMLNACNKYKIEINDDLISHLSYKYKSNLSDKRFDENLADAFDTLYNNPNISNMCTKLFPFADQASITFYNYIKALREIGEQKFKISARQEFIYEKKLRQIWKKNERLKENIIKTNDKVEEQRKVFNTELEEKKIFITDYQKRIADLRAQCKDKIDAIITESEVLMSAHCNESEVRQKQLKGEATSTALQYEKMLEDNLDNEKLLRAKKFKVETQLQSWLQKYDNDIGLRQDEWELINKGYEEEKKELMLLKEKFDEQEKEYNALMAEKEEEEQRIFEEKCYLFILNRSARRIQRCWREYWARKKTRRKGKGKKAKK